MVVPGRDTRDSVQAFLSEAGLTPAQLGAIGNDGWVATPDGPDGRAAAQVMIDLPSATRARMYNTLTADERNGSQNTPEITFRNTSRSGWKEADCPTRP